MSTPKTLTLAEFMKRMLGFAEKVEAAGSPAELATVRGELTKAQMRIAELEAQLATAVAAQSTFEVTINDLNSTVQTLETKSKSLEAELANAKTEAARILAGQGIDPSTLPGTAANNSPTGHGTSELDRLRAQRDATKDPKELYTLNMKIRELLEKK